MVLPNSAGFCFMTNIPDVKKKTKNFQFALTLVKLLTVFQKLSQGGH